MERPESLQARLAQSALERFVRDGQRLAIPPDVPDELVRAAGCFVSLHIEDRLRGCIGTIEPVEPSLAEEIITNAISAGTRDPRFRPVTEDELEMLAYSVDVLNRPEPIESLQGHDPKVCGLIVESAHGGRRGLLLPDLEGVDDAEQQLAICLTKAGIGAGDPVLLSRFTVTRHH